MSTTITTKACFYCYHPIDLANDPHIKFKALHNMPHVFGDDPEVYAHELCAAEAEDEHLRDKALEAQMDDRLDGLSELLYYEVYDGE